MSRSSSATLLIGFDPRTALAIARSLWRAKIRVIVATIAEWETPLTSRAVAAFVKLPGPERPPEEFREELEALIATHSVDTIMPVTDRALLMLSPCFEYLSERVHLASPSPAQTAVILDKTSAASLAAGLNVPIPRSFETSSLCQHIDELPFPLFAKSRDKRIYVDNDTSVRPGAHFVQDAAALRLLLGDSPTSCLLVEEYFVGDDVGLAVLMKEGQALAALQYRAEILYPAKGGVSVVARTEIVDPALLEAAVKLLRALDWHGVAQLDFRHNRKTGKFAFLEINGRFWGSTAVAILAGLDLPLFAWQLAHGETPVLAGPYKVGLRARWFEGDVRRLLLLFSERHELTLGGRIRELFGFLLRFRFGTSGMFWSWRDPRPAIETWFHFSKNWLIGKFRRVSSSKKHPNQPTASAKPDENLETAARIQRQNLGK